MIKVNNGKAIRRLSFKSLLANHTRNIIAVLAIALTAMLFTALFTIAMTLMNTVEQQTARQIGGNMDGAFKRLSLTQLNELKTDPLIKEYGTRLMLGIPDEAPFNKAHVEISYMDEVNAHGSFCVPEQGRLPAEGTKELACDTRILQLLGVTPQLGAQVELPCRLGYTSTAPKYTYTDTFTLVGWWAYDEASIASHALLPLSYVQEKLAGYVNENPLTDDTGTWTLNVSLKSRADIEQTLRTILANHGYQCDDAAADNYIGIGVSWAAMSTALNQGADPLALLSIAVLLAVVVLTGYLIIYNVFQISISNDIRFYGLLKTIGTTPRQIRRIVRGQALALCLPGIPLGLLAGYWLGVVLAPSILNMMSFTRLYNSTSPLIFVAAALFALLTVLFSCAKPGLMAGRVSPIEALRYTEGAGDKKTSRRAANGGSPLGMALANLSRSAKKTVLVAISLSLAVVLMQITYTLATGFDMDKYLNKWVVTDFILSDAGYFQSHSGSTFTRQDIDAVQATGLVTEGTATTECVNVSSFVPEDYFRNRYVGFLSEEQIQTAVDAEQRDENGLLSCTSNLYGMDDFALDKITLLEGNLAPLRDPNQKAIAAVYYVNDNGDIDPTSHFARLGDTVTVRYVDEWEYYSLETGEVVDNPDDMALSDIGNRPKAWHDVQYTVTALVNVPTPISFRYSGPPQYVLNGTVMAQDAAEEPTLLYYAFNTAPEDNAAMEQFLNDYTENVMPNLSFESKQLYVSQFTGVRNMFLLLGGVLSAVVAVVGMLNFLNAILTSIISRRREFATLQAIGMTGRQLNAMLIWEGVIYALFAGAVSLVLSLAVGAAMQQVVGSVLWFFTYRFTLLPLCVMLPAFVLLGVILPSVAYRFAAKQSIVERLRQSE